MRKILLVLFALTAVACAKPLIRGQVSAMSPFEQSFPVGPNAAYYAIRWALSARGYPVATEDLPGGIITTAWVPVGVDSHFKKPFRTPDFGVTGAYHQLQLEVIPIGGATTVKITSQVKGIVEGLKSSGFEEKRLFEEMKNYLHSGHIEITNLGVEG